MVVSGLVLLPNLLVNKNKLAAPTTPPAMAVRCGSSQRNDDDEPSKSKSSKLPLAASLFGTGFILGPMIDGIHSGARLVVYQDGAIDIGPLHTSIWVPPLLASFYLVVGLLQLSLDSMAAPTTTTEASPERTASSLM